MFVLAVAQLGRGLVVHPSLSGAATFLGLFVPVWWAWVGFVFFLSRFDHETVFARLLVLGAMFASLVMAVELPAAFAGRTAGLAVAYGAVRAVLVVMYVRAARGHEGDQRAVAAALGSAFAVGAALWLASSLVPAPLRYVVWALAMIVELGAPVRFGARLARAPIDAAHLPERFGLFVIIVLGEGVVTVGSAVGPVAGGAAILAAVCGFALVASIWWTYFDRAALVVGNAIAEHEAIGVAARDVYSYGHFPVVCGIVVQSAGIQLLVGGAAHGQMPGATVWLVSLGTAVYLAGMSAIQFALSRDGRAPVLWARLGVGALLVALAVVGTQLSAGGFAVAAAVPVALLAGFGARRARTLPPTGVPG